MVWQKLKAYIVDHGIKQTWLAEKIGMNRARLSMILSGQSSLSVDDFALICSALNVSADLILTYEVEA